MTTNSPAVSITGIGSVSPNGALAGLIPPSTVEPSAITAWTTAGLRRAFLVNPFRPASVVPGLKTRRLDRLSAWALVASSLAIQDAGIDLTQVDRSLPGSPRWCVPDPVWPGTATARKSERTPNTRSMCALSLPR